MEILLDTIKWSVIVGVLTLVLTLLKPAFEKRYSARWRYWAWLALAVLALLAPVQWKNLLSAAPTVTAPVIIDVPEMELQVIQGDRVSVAVQPVSALPPVNAETRRTWQMGEILPGIWLAGTAAFGLRTLAGAWFFRRRARRWSRPPEEETSRLYEAVRQDMGLKKAPPLRIGGTAGSPMLLGVVRPCLLLPGGEWDELELTFILRHELTHYRRRDLWYKLVLLAANALHWFNPLMYLLVREAGADLELTCDDAVVSGMDREARRAYSEALLSAIRREKGPALSTHFYGGKEVMKERFRNILGKRGRKWGALALALTLLATVVSACAVGLRQASPERLSGTDSNTPNALEIPSGEPGLTGESSESADAVRYHNGEFGMILPAEYAGELLVSPPERPMYSSYNEANLVFSVYHRDTYLNEEPSKYNGYVMSIERYTGEEFAEIEVFVWDHGYPFATDNEGHIYCVAWMHDINVPPEIQPAMWEFLDVDILQIILNDFTNYNSLTPYSKKVSTGPLAQSDLTDFANYFNAREHNGLLRFSYSSFEDLRLYLNPLFYDLGEPVTDEAERAAVAEAIGGDLETDCTKLTVDFIVDYFNTNFIVFGNPDWVMNRNNFNTSFGQILESTGALGPYLTEYDAYYIVHGDTEMRNYTFTGGERYTDGSVTLDYTADIWHCQYNGNEPTYYIEWDRPMRATLQPYGTGWKIVSNERRAKVSG